MPAVKLSFSAVVAESFGFFFGHIRLFFHIVTIPWILSIAIRIIDGLLTSDSPLAILVEKAIDVIPSVMFMVAWQRIVLLGPNSLDRLPGTGWSPRETAYLGHLIKVGGMTFVLVSVFLITVGPVDPAALRAGAAMDPEVARRYALAGPLAFGFILSLLLALRVSFGLAASAVDIPFTPRLSWAHSRGNAWTIIGALFLVYFGGAVATAVAAKLTQGIMQDVLGAQEAAAVVTWTVVFLISYGVLAITVTVQAVIFRRLTGWRAGAAVPAPLPS